MPEGYAYEIGKNYYFSIAKFPKYGRLSHLDMTGLRSGVRVAADEYEKESISDFALWKAWDDNDGEVFWETELGKGRPGWHIECSAMSTKYLGETFDIHTGGVDNMFPHHENEIAQSEGAYGKEFVKFWLHSEHLLVEGIKMSKRFNNYYTLRDVLDKGYSPIAVRYVLLATHYRQQLNFTFDGLVSARNSLERYNDFYYNLKDYKGGESSGEAGQIVDKMLVDFEEALDDDLNISPALATVFDFVRDINRLKAQDRLNSEERDLAIKALERINTVLNFLIEEKSSVNGEIEVLIQERALAKKNRDFVTADRIRNRLNEMGIVLEDSSSGTKWKKKL